MTGSGHFNEAPLALNSQVSLKVDYSHGTCKYMYQI